MSSYIALVCDRDASLTVFIDDCCWPALTLKRVGAEALFERGLSLSDVVLLLFTLSYSLYLGAMPVVGRTAFCRKPKRLPLAAAIDAGCVWSRLGGWRRGVVRPVVSLSPVFCSPVNRFVMIPLAFHTILSFISPTLDFNWNVEKNTKVNVKSCFQL